MAKLVVQIDGAPARILELRKGLHRVGRSSENDFVITHASVSMRHCEFELTDEGLWIRDLQSTNGTFLDGQPVMSACAQSGQVIHLGRVACAVEEVVPQVNIPQWQEPEAPEFVKGTKPCVNHPEFPASMECTHCHKVFCGACVHILRRSKGTTHKLCPICSNHCVPIEGMNSLLKHGSTFLRLLKKLKPKHGRRGRRGQRGVRGRKDWR